MSFDLIHLTFRTMFQIITQIARQIANIVWSEHLFETFDVIRMLIVMSQSQNVWYNEMKNAKTTKFVNMIVDNKIIKTKNQIIFLFTERQFCDVLVVNIEYLIDLLSIQINLVIIEYSIAKVFFHFDQWDCEQNIKFILIKVFDHWRVDIIVD